MPSSPVHRPEQARLNAVWEETLPVKFKAGFCAAQAHLFWYPSNIWLHDTLIYVAGTFQRAEDRSSLVNQKNDFFHEVTDDLTSHVQGLPLQNGSKVL